MLSPSASTPNDDLELLRLTCDRLKQQLGFQSAFLGTASHELRAPINQIISLHQLILEDLCESPAEEREFIAQANQAITTVLRNLDTLISLSKFDIGALKPTLQPVDLATLLTEVQQLTTMKCINRYCRLTLAPLEEGLTVQSDAPWLQQALVTLVDAALAADSTHIQLAAQANGDHGVLLTLACNGNLGQWSLDPEKRPDPEAIATTPTDSPQHRGIPVLSPAFGYHLAARMVAHLQGTLTQDCSSTLDQRLVQISLPLAEPHARE